MIKCHTLRNLVPLVATITMLRWMKSRITSTWSQYGLAWVALSFLGPSELFPWSDSFENEDKGGA